MKQQIKSKVKYFEVVVFTSELITASVDKTLALWDLHTGERRKRLKGHQGFINSCDVARRGPQLVCSASDDGTVKVSFIQ